MEIDSVEGQLTQIEGEWVQVKGKLKEKWAEITDDDIARVEGKREQLIGVLQERYACTREEAERQVNAFEASFI